MKNQSSYRSDICNMWDTIDAIRFPSLKLTLYWFAHEVGQLDSDYQTSSVERESHLKMYTDQRRSNYCNESAKYTVPQNKLKSSIANFECGVKLDAK